MNEMIKSTNSKRTRYNGTFRKEKIRSLNEVS